MKINFRFKLVTNIVKKYLKKFKHFSLIIFWGTGSAAYGDDSIDEIFEGLKSELFEIRKTSREKLNTYVASEKNEVINKMLSFYVDHRSPEVQFSIKMVLMHRLYGKGFLGVTHTEAVIEHKSKKYISRRLKQVTPGGPAAISGLKAGDLIFKIGAAKPILVNTTKPIHIQHNEAANALSTSIKKLKPGSKFTITVMRENKFITFRPILGSYQNYIALGKNLASFLQNQQLPDAYGFSEQDNKQFRALVTKFKASRK